MTPSHHGNEERATTADAMHQLLTDLFPIHRSITGEGVRQTLERLQREIPLAIHEVESGRQVFDWTVPDEWNISDGFIKSLDGERIIDYRQSNLHVVSYSQPIHKTMSWLELREHVHSLPEHAEWIPYRTSYFDDDWGFCMTHGQFAELERFPDREYEVRIDSNLQPGALTYGEFFLPGRSTDEFLISCHTCHPSLANDNLSGIAVATWLAKSLASMERKYSYRFVFVPATIGAITWLAGNTQKANRTKLGLVLALLGGDGAFTYTDSRWGDSLIDRAAHHVISNIDPQGSRRPFRPMGYDQRQYCSPGFNLPMGCLMRTPYGEFPEYHTSADNLDFVQGDQLAESLSLCHQIIWVVENNATYINQSPYGEPQLGHRGLYRAFAHQDAPSKIQEAVLWVLNFSDGQHTLLDIAERSQLPFDVVCNAAKLLVEHELLKRRESTTEKNSSIQFPNLLPPIQQTFA